MTEEQALTTSFEDRLKRLNDIVDRLEKGDAPLEESLNLYKEGLNLAAGCRTQLAEARLEITTLTREQFPELAHDFNEDEDRS